MGNSGENNPERKESGGPKDESPAATSKKILSDIEEAAKATVSTTNDGGSAPAPDGQFENKRDERDNGEREP